MGWILKILRIEEWDLRILKIEDRVLRILWMEAWDSNDSED